MKHLANGHKVGLQGPHLGDTASAIGMEGASGVVLTVGIGSEQASVSCGNFGLSLIVEGLGSNVRVFYSLPKDQITLPSRGE